MADGAKNAAVKCTCAPLRVVAFGRGLGDHARAAACQQQVGLDASGAGLPREALGEESPRTQAAHLEQARRVLPTQDFGTAHPEAALDAAAPAAQVLQDGRDGRSFRRARGEAHAQQLEQELGISGSARPRSEVHEGRSAQPLRWVEVERTEPLLAGDPEEVAQEEQLVQGDSEGPDVGRDADGLAAAHVAHLGRPVLRGGGPMDLVLFARHLVRRHAARVDKGVRRGRAEVAQAPPAVGIGEQKVLGLDVAVGERRRLAMHVAEGQRHVVQRGRALGRRERRVLFHAAEQQVGE